MCKNKIQRSNKILVFRLELEKYKVKREETGLSLIDPENINLNNSEIITNLNNHLLNVLNVSIYKYVCSLR